ncbi:MAG TPA: flagellar assembly protein A, partial [Rhodocyclaceae bacterium]|nr:flagellar assembly protein A [Rhodocyclaceae bacterium]
KLPSSEVFLQAVDRVFSSGFLFGGLDYAALLKLLYDFDVTRSVDHLRIASEIREFPPARRALYKGVRIAGGEAVYMFEPVELESTVDEPVYETDANGEQKVIGSERKVVAEKASLELDEFVAEMWAKGVRFGIDIPAVQAAIREGKCERVVVARTKEAKEGQDAGVKEETDALHRDNRPRRLLDGRVDLSQFKNRFPQIKKGTLLFRKTPRELGEPGRTVSGQYLAPPVPKDFDLSGLAGEGTCIETRDGCEYIIAAKDGFLNLDTKTNCISVTEKIVNRDGVSARTTGNLVLTGDEYEEFGEVQEGRVVEGKGLTFHADVFGKVLSSGGNIVLEQNLVGGAAVNRNGSIAVAGLTSNALVQTASGVIHLARAENSILIGDRVEVESAHNCIILADSVEIEKAEGGAIAGRRVHIEAGAGWSGQELLVSMLLPDFSGINQAQKKELGYLAECEELVAGLKRGIDSLMEQPELQKYFALAGKIHRKEITLTSEQQGQWQQMSARQAPALKRISQGRQDMKSLEGEMQGVRERIAAFETEKSKAVGEVECRIDSVQGDVIVRTLVQPLDAPPLSRLPPRDLKQRLRAPDEGGKRLFAGNTGQFSWKPA